MPCVRQSLYLLACRSSRPLGRFHSIYLLKTSHSSQTKGQAGNRSVERPSCFGCPIHKRHFSVLIGPLRSVFSATAVYPF